MWLYATWLATSAREVSSRAHRSVLSDPTPIPAPTQRGSRAFHARANASKANAVATFVAGILPLAFLVYLFGWFEFHWTLPIGYESLAGLLVSTATVQVSCIVVGFLGAGLAANWIARSD